MQMSKRLQSWLSQRIDAGTKEKFDKKCDAINRKPAEVVRELLKAFAEDRIKITPDSETKAAMELYK